MIKIEDCVVFDDTDNDVLFVFPKQMSEGQAMSIADQVVEYARSTRAPIIQLLQMAHDELRQLKSGRHPHTDRYEPFHSQAQLAIEEHHDKPYRTCHICGATRDPAHIKLKTIYDPAECFDFQIVFCADDPNCVKGADTLVTADTGS